MAAETAAFVRPSRCARSYSVADVDLEALTKLRRHGDTLRRLDYFYGLAKRQLMSYQSCTTGHFPESSNSDLSVSDIRTSLYVAFALWSLYQAYKRIDDSRGKAHELGLCVVKCMRGILISWAKQSDLIEKFKNNQTPENAVHSKFDLETGDHVYTYEQYNHLQIDVVSLYLLFLVQFTSSGLQIVFCTEEIAVVQNLVFYIERAYRTPDFGMWQRGSKYNNGSTEIRASSVGLVKAALEAVNGCNLYGFIGGSQSVLYVDIDAHNRNRVIFETLLPRESSSTSADMALLIAISFPVFATHDKILYTKTKKKLVQRLRGNYGFKRFTRDGFGTVLEDPDVRYYSNGSIEIYENIECEWPLFYMYMVIDAIFTNDNDQKDEYVLLIQNLLVRNSDGDPIVPLYYYVPMDFISDERRECGSQPRQPNSTTVHHLWPQAIYIVMSMLLEDLVHINEIDIVRRYLSAYNRPRKNTRYSSFHGTTDDLVVNIVLVSESHRLQAMLATYGIQSQTPKEMEPVQLWSQKDLVKVFCNLGRCDSLNLSGRPSRPIGGLGTSKIYRLCGQTIICYPLILESVDFYLSYDMELLIDDIRSEIQFIGDYWMLNGRPICCLLIKETHMRDASFKKMLDLLAMFKSGNCGNFKVRLCRIQNLASCCCTEHLDFVKELSFSELKIKPFKGLCSNISSYQSLTDIPLATNYVETEHRTLSQLSELNTEQLYNLWPQITTLRGRALILTILKTRVGFDYILYGSSVYDHLVYINSEAGMLRCWSLVRYCSSLLSLVVDSISPYLATLLVSGRQCSIGVRLHQEHVINKPMTPSELKTLFYSKLASHDLLQAVLQQELVLYCGKLAVTQPSLFTGILNIRIPRLLQAMKLYNNSVLGSDVEIESLSPYEIKSLLLTLLQLDENNDNSNRLLQLKIAGCLGRSARDFHCSVWFLLTRSVHGMCVDGKCLPQKPTIVQMSVNDLRFAIMINSLFEHTLPELRQIYIQLISCITTILERNPELSFTTIVDLTQLVKEACQIYIMGKITAVQNQTDASSERVDSSTTLSVNDDQKTVEFYGLPSHVLARYLARAVVNHLLKLTSNTADQSTLDFTQSCNIS